MSFTIIFVFYLNRTRLHKIITDDKISQQSRLQKIIINAMMRFYHYVFAISCIMSWRCLWGLPIPTFPEFMNAVVLAGRSLNGVRNWKNLRDGNFHLIHYYCVNRANKNSLMSSGKSENPPMINFIIQLCLRTKLCKIRKKTESRV